MGQHWKNAPVYFTVAQVRFNPILSLDTYLPALQELLRKAGFPDYKPLQRFVLTLSATTGQEEAKATQELHNHYAFSNMEGTAGLVLTQESLSYQTTRYQDFGQFSEALFKALVIVHQVVGLDYSERIGLRYLDAVMPRDGEDLKQYIVPEVLGLSDKLPTILHAYTETMALDESGNRVISRTIVQHGRIGFPPDLGQVSLAVADRFTQFKEAPHAILDNDASLEKREAFDISTLQNRLEDLHSLIRKAFKASITDYAEQVWKGEA